MVKKEDIEKLINEAVEGSDIFLVEVTVRQGNLIRVFVDEPRGISLDECVRISRAIESGLDREEEDFDLQVSSPGLENPLLVLPQYLKNIGRELKIETVEKERLTGELLGADKDGISINAQVKVKTPGSKKKQIEFQEKSLKFEEIKSAKVNLQFNG